MEGLKLEDLEFDTNDDVMDSYVETEDLTNITNDDIEDKKINTDSENQDDSESVATVEKDKVQEGKTSDVEGGDSSSPKLNDSEKLYSTLATHFKTKGVLPELENTDDIKSLDDFEAAIQKRIENGLSDKQKAIDTAIRAGLPPKEVSEQIDVISKLKSITDDFISSDKGVEFRKNAIAQDFLSRGYSPERSQELALRSVNLGTDIEDAKFALKSVISIEEGKYENMIEEARNKESKGINDIKDYIESKEEILPSIKLNKEQKEDIYKKITTDVGNKNNEFLLAQNNDPVGTRVKIEALFHLTKGFSDFSIFSNSKQTDISRDLENMLRGTSFTEDGKIQTSSKDRNSSFTLKDLEDLEIE